jgi:flavodoxin
MNALVVFDSKFGNTRQIAQAIARVLGKHGQVKLVSVDDADTTDLTTADLLAIGGPTQAHGLTVALHNLLGGIPERALDGTGAIAFDTRFHMPSLLTGSAGAQIEKMLRALGCDILLPHESFFITASEGPLVEGEMERAADWAERAVRKFETTGTLPVGA